MKKRWNCGITALFFTLCLTACSGSPGDTAAKNRSPGELVIYCPHPLEFINPIVSEFEMRTGIEVTVYNSGTVELLDMVENKEEPLCDVFWGGSLSTTSSRNQLFEPYISENEPMIHEEFRNTEGNMTRFTDLPSVLMVNKNLTGDLVIEGYEDLLQPELKGKIAMCSPSTSSSANEHLINMLYAMGKGDPENGWAYVEEFCLQLNGRLLSSSSEVYHGVADGRFAVGLTFEEGASHFVDDDGPVELVYMKEGVISKADSVCIIKGTENLKKAKEFVNFVTGKDAQEIITSSLGRRSVRMDVEEPAYFPSKSSIHLISDDLDLVNDKKEEWILKFDQIYRSTLQEHGGEGS